MGNLRKNRYSVPEESSLSIQAWMESEVMRPDIFIIAPEIKDVGEQQLIQDLARASYERQGLRDSRARHFLSRAFPFTDSEVAYARFLDEAFDTAEISDEFYGVDNIDLTAWMDIGPNQRPETWRQLTDYVLDHPETDFVFTCFTDDPHKADSIISSLRESCGIAVEVIELDYPDASMLAQAFDEQSDYLFAEDRDLVLAGINRMLSNNRRMNYSFIESCALSAVHMHAVLKDKRNALEKTMDRFANMTPQASRRHVIGF